jgi:hypothetical protein
MRAAGADLGDIRFTASGVLALLAYEADLIAQRAQDPGTRGMGRSFLWAVVVGNALLGGGLAAVALAMLAMPDERTWSVTACVLGAVGGAIWVAGGSVGFWRMYLHRTPADGRRVTDETIDGHPSVLLRWSTTLVTVPVLSLTGLVTVLLGAGVALRIQGHGAAGPFLVLALLLALLLPDGWGRARRRPFLALDERGLTSHGWDGDAFLAWDDIEGVMLADAGQWSVVRFVGRLGAPSYTWRRRRRFLLAVNPSGPHVEAPTPALDVDPAFLSGTVVYYAQTPSARAEITNGTARRRLVEQLRPAR